MFNLQSHNKDVEVYKDELNFDIQALEKLSIVTYL